MNLKGKLAIVTGASSGIGKEVALALLAKGCRVAGWSRRDPGITHTDFLFVQTEIRDIQSVQNAYEATVEEFGDLIDVLVNNAGVGFFHELEKMDLEEWHAMFDTNVNGIFYTTRLVLPGMKREKKGHIINISSIAGLQGINEGTGYCATKFAVRGLSQALYQETKKHNVKVTCVYPGSVNTEFFSHYEGVKANPTMLDPKEVADMLVHTIETPGNFVTTELEIRPVAPKYQ